MKKLTPTQDLCLRLGQILGRWIDEGDPQAVLTTEDFLAVCRVVWLDFGLRPPTAEEEEDNDA